MADHSILMYELLIRLFSDLRIARLLACLCNNLWIMKINNKSLKRCTMVRLWTSNIKICYRGMSCAHFREMVLAAPSVVALWSSGTLFHIFAIIFDAKEGNPGTGGRISFENWDLVDLILGLSWKRYFPSGFMVIFDFQTVSAVIEATASFRHLRFALCRSFSDGTFSESLVCNVSSSFSLCLSVFRVT